jgi:hypothetical protein
MRRGLIVRGAVVVVGIALLLLVRVLPLEDGPTNIGLGLVSILGWVLILAGVLLLGVDVLNAKRTGSPEASSVADNSGHNQSPRWDGSSRRTAEQRIASRFRPHGTSPTGGQDRTSPPDHRDGPVIFTVVLGCFFTLVGAMSFAGRGGVFSALVLAAGLFLIIAGFANGRDLRKRGRRNRK